MPRYTNIKWEGDKCIITSLKLAENGLFPIRDLNIKDIKNRRSVLVGCLGNDSNKVLELPYNKIDENIHHTGKKLIKSKFGPKYDYHISYFDILKKLG
jgi:hypothetical protein